MICEGYLQLVNLLNTHKSGGVVIPDGLGIPKGLQSRISLDDLILQRSLWKMIVVSSKSVISVWNDLFI